MLHAPCQKLNPQNYLILIISKNGKFFNVFRWFYYINNYFLHDGFWEGKYYFCFSLYLLLSFFSCSGYEKSSQKPGLLNWSLKGQCTIIIQRKWVRASTLFDQIAPVYRGTIKADTVFYYQARSYYMQKDYILSGHYFNTLAVDYPNSSLLRKLILWRDIVTIFNRPNRRLIRKIQLKRSLLSSCSW